MNMKELRHDLWDRSEEIELLQRLGFNGDDAIKALLACEGKVEAAASFLFRYAGTGNLRVGEPTSEEVEVQELGEIAGAGTGTETHNDGQTGTSVAHEQLEPLSRSLEGNLTADTDTPKENRQRSTYPQALLKTKAKLGKKTNSATEMRVSKLTTKKKKRLKLMSWKKTMKTTKMMKKKAKTKTGKTTREML